MAARDLTQLARTRSRLDELTKRRIAVHADLAKARTALADAVRVGRPAAEIRRAQAAIDRLRQTDRSLGDQRTTLIDQIRSIRDRIRLDDPEKSVAQLAGGVPVCLLPVRLETRFAEAATKLRIRIYPEQLHVDAHEPELTDDEVTAGRQYWLTRWSAGSDPAVSADAWLTLARLTRPPRARWIAQACTPTNVDQIGVGQPDFADVPRRPGPWTRAPVARLLPEQWVAIGYQNGGEVFRVWSGPVADEVTVGLAPDLDDTGDGAPVPDVQDELPIDDGMRWMLDYDEAVRVGMAVTVADADLTSGLLVAGLDQLLVIGVDWTLTPDAGAEALSAQLDRHAVSDGLAVLGPGTATNNTDEDRAGPDTDPLLDPAAYDPATPPAHPSAARLAGALATPGAVGLLDAPGSGGLDDGVATDMVTALWAPTVGYFLDQIARPLVPTETATRLLDHARRHLRGGGPYPALRVGRQPYGVLPVLSGPVASGDALLSDLSGRLSGLRFLWNAMGPEPVPRLGDGDRADADLVELLRRTPRSETFRFREASKPTYWSSIFGFEVMAQVQEQVARIILGLAGISADTELTSIVADTRHRPVPVPLVSFGELSEIEPLDPNYIKTIHGQTTVAGGFARLLGEPSEASTLLQALLRHAAGLEIAIGSTALVLEHELNNRIILEQPRVASVYDREVHDIVGRRLLDDSGDSGDSENGDDGESGDDIADSLLAKVSGVVELAEQNVRAISGDRSLADFLSTASDAQLLRRIPTRRFAEFRASLSRLADVPSAELQRRAADTLDCAAHRLDAWITSVATSQLERIRAVETGCHVGAFGYVEGLRPSSDSASLGFIHGPSIAHATTAAILRSGHLARRQDDDGLLAIDLTSSRVDRGLELVEGVRNGQPIGALLGYRFERGLRDRRITLAQYILPFRRLAPLASSSAGPPDGVPIEVVAARDVVDGLRLLERWKSGRAGLFTEAGVAAADRSDVDAVLTEIDDALDAVSDLLMAESVHQAVLGNAERSAAALDALDRQEAIPELGFVKTPRTGSGYQHRLAVLTGSVDPAAGWGGLDDPRRAAEPRLDHWIGTVLGDPDRIRLGANVLDEDGQQLQAVSARLPDLGLSAIATVMACSGTGDGASELEQRLAGHLGSLVTAPDAAKLVLLDDPPPGSTAGSIGLRQLLDLGAELTDLLASARPADARDLAPETERPDAGHDRDELRVRADAAVAALTSARTDLAAFGSDPPPAALGPALLALADAGQRVAVLGDGDPARALAAADRTLAEVSALDAAFDRVAASEAAQVAHDLARIRSVFGDAFPVLAVFATTNGSELATSAADGALLAGDPLAATTWLTRYGLVRPAAARLVSVLEASEMLNGGTALDELTVAQLPHHPGDRWIGLPWDPPGVCPQGHAAVVAHMADGAEFDGPMAGLIVDQWTDIVPNDQETTGLSFHYDAPGARAPQSILISVPADPSARSWSVDALAGTVREAMDLARMRAYDIDDLAGVGRFLPAIYLPFNIEAKTPTLNLSAVIAKAVELANVHFIEEQP